MRYRPFGRSGSAISNLTMRLGASAVMRGPDYARQLIFQALEGGVNAYVLESADPVLAEIVGGALSVVERDLVTVFLTLGAGDGRRGSERDFSGEGLTQAMERVLNVSGLGWIDVALLDQPGEDELPQSALQALKALRSAGHIKLIGVAGDGPVMDAYVSTGAFDVLVTPYHANSSWQVRARIRAAREQDMAILASGFFPDSLARPRKPEAAFAPQKKGLFGLGGKTPAATEHDPAGSFAFLHHMPGWSAEQLCLAYTLTDPSMSSAVIDIDTPERLAALIDTPERDLPAGLAAQIEMARVRSAAA